MPAPPRGGHQLSINMKYVQDDVSSSSGNEKGVLREGSNECSWRGRTTN